ncbi:MAG: hypothetical protein M3Y87_26125, partial [Myxococcota bacterium]|nr:hypothetical protein [Myxococcota bacterium]
MLRFLAAVAIAFVGSACCVNPVDPPPPDPCGPFGCARDAGAPLLRDGEVPPIAPLDLCDTAEFGAPCELACARPGLTCYGERRATTTIETDGGIAMLEAIAFPNGMCSRPCASDSECGACAACVDHALAGRARLRGLVEGSGVCRPRCSDSFECGEGSACDPELGACVEACTSDEQCRFTTVDSDGDGVEDALAYEPDTELVCIAGRCRPTAASIGERCVDSTACEPGFACLQAELGVPGRCGRVGCAPGS